MATDTRRSAGVTGAYVIVTCLFFAWGFITSLVDPLVAAVKGIFELSDFEAQLSASAFFIAYGVMSFPAAVLLGRKKSVPTLLIALGLMIAGCLIMLVAANVGIYAVVLAGLFVLASGITILQVAANPLAAALGPPEKSHFRLTFSQTFNSLGTFIGPYLGAVLFLKGVEVNEGAISEQVRDASLAGIDRAFFWIAGLILLIAVLIWAGRRLITAAAPPPPLETAQRGIAATVRDASLAGIDRAFFWIAGLILLIAVLIWAGRRLITTAAPPPPIETAQRGIAATVRDALSSKWTVFGGLAIFLYVGAEVAIGTQMALFLNSDDVWGVSLEDAAKMVSLYWGGAMVGRLVGSALLTRVPAAPLLALFTAIACALCLFCFLVGGVPAGYAALSIGLFNSIMFPLIFSLTLERSTASEEATSGFLCFSIIGGAVIPPVVGLVSQSTSYATAFIVPAACYAILCAFAMASRGAKTDLGEEPSVATIH
ncbi:MAG: sugar MFS transporter [Pseudomonadota bacterium]|nr:sugar MFS transporter [Pseudomonadota bacterium]